MTISRSHHAPRLTLPVGPRDHIRGPKAAPVTLVEYGDYQCPFCGAAHPVVNEILDLEPNGVRFVFRHFPLTTIHPLAEPAAEAAEAAGAQGKFWQMHDWIYEHQDTMAPDDLLAAAADLGLDLTRFSSDVMGHRHEQKIREDFMSGVRSGVNGTPTFFINGVRHDGGYDLDALLGAIEVAAPA
jgi:protein-disulfide isomerase